MFKYFLTLAGAVVFALTHAAQAATISLEAKISNVTGSADLLSYIGINSGGTLTAYVTLDNDHSVPDFANNTGSYHISYKTSTVNNLILSTPLGGLWRGSAPSGYVNSRDIVSASVGVNEAISFYNGSTVTAPEGQMRLDSYTNHGVSSEWGLWDRPDPITASVLNNMPNNTFSWFLLMDGAIHNISSSDVSYTQVSAIPSLPAFSPAPAPVPLPASALLVLGGLGGLGFLRRFKKPQIR